MKVVLTGATGLLGRPLARRLVAAGHEVVALARDPERARPLLPVRAAVERWQATAPLPPDLLRGADAVIHLAGENVAGGRWTAARKEAIRASRVAGSAQLVGAIAALPAAARPRLLVAASATGWYGDQGERVLDETAPAGTGFLADVCRAWEAESGAAAAHGVRTVVLRIGVVLARAGGALPRLLPPFRLGLGGRVGAGTQWMSWIHRDDVLGLFEHALAADGLAGTVNAVAPAPVTNAAFTAALGRALHRPTVLPVPAVALRLALGEMATLLVASQRVRPARALAAGYNFRFPDLAGALSDLLADDAQTLWREQWVPRPVAEVFPFFSDPRNLERLTPPFLRFHVRGTSTPEVRAGTLIDYTLRLRGVPLRWRSRIEEWQPGRRFIDVQLRGPYRLWHHTHEFEPWRGGTILRDVVRWALPLEPLSGLIAGPMVRGDLERIFAYRRRAVDELFGPPAAGN